MNFFSSSIKGIIAALLFTFMIQSCELINLGDVVELSIPENVLASDDKALSITLTWDEVEGSEGYNIYRADYIEDTLTEKLSFDLIGETDIASYDDISVISELSYYYKILAFSEDTESEFSEFILGSTILLSVEEAFNGLASYTDGEKYDASTASEVPNIIINVINDQVAGANTDLVFLIDNTGSMSDDIGYIITNLTSIISELPAGTKLSIAVYNDANLDAEGWYKYTELSSVYSNAVSFLNSISVYGGGDIPESVYDGIYLTVDKLSWRESSKKMIIVIGDAPPLEGELTTYSLAQVIDKCTKNEISVNLYPILIGGSSSYKKNQQ